MTVARDIDVVGSENEKHRVALSSVVAAVFLTGMKLAVGLMTGSLGILSEAAHSGLDLVAALVTLFAVRVSDKPADEVHQFGHGKIENLSALVETLLLLLTCVWIIYEAISRLFFKSVEVDANIWAFVALAISIGIDVSRSRALMKVAKAHNSQALEADALHFSTDVWSSAVVLVGLALLRLADAVGLPWLKKADAAAALIVAGIVIWVSIRLGKRAVAVLLDAAPIGLRDQIERRLATVVGVAEIRQVRVRQAGPQSFVDLTIAVREDASLQESHGVAGAVEDAVTDVVSNADVIVHVETIQPDSDDLSNQVRSIAATHGIRVHGLHAHEVGGKMHLDLHVEVDESLTLQEAHDQVTRFERELAGAWGSRLVIVSHIEPVGAITASPAINSVADDRRIRALISEVILELCGPDAVHNVSLITNPAGKRDLSLHCYLKGDTPVTDAHHASDQAEKMIRRRLPDLGRIVIHVEPE